MGKVAIVLKTISPIIKKGDRLIKRGKNYVLTGYTKPHIIEYEYAKSKGKKFKTPNFYPVQQVESTKDYFRIVKVG